MFNSELHRLQQIFNQLSPEHQQMLLAFAEFLQTRVVSNSAPPRQPQYLPRPADESVVAAIKRLSQSYPMLEKAKILDKTSSLMTEHILQGRDKVSVINELEVIFEQHYKEFMREQTT
jgi:hypothetical protein